MIVLCRSQLSFGFFFSRQQSCGEAQLPGMRATRVCAMSSVEGRQVCVWWQLCEASVVLRPVVGVQLGGLRAESVEQTAIHASKPVTNSHISKPWIVIKQRYIHVSKPVTNSWWSCRKCVTDVKWNIHIIIHFFTQSPTTSQYMASVCQYTSLIVSTCYLTSVSFHVTRTCHKRYGKSGSRYYSCKTSNLIFHETECHSLALSHPKKKFPVGRTKRMWFENSLKNGTKTWKISQAWNDTKQPETWFRTAWDPTRNRMKQHKNSLK